MNYLDLAITIFVVTICMTSIDAIRKLIMQHAPWVMQSVFNAFYITSLTTIIYTASNLVGVCSYHISYQEMVTTFLMCVAIHAVFHPLFVREQL